MINLNYHITRKCADTAIRALCSPYYVTIMSFQISNAILSHPLRAATVQQASRETGESRWWWWWWCVHYAHLSILHHRTHTEGGDPCRRHLWHYSNNWWDPDCQRVWLFIWLWPLWSDKDVICCCAGMWEARANDQEQNDAVFKVSDL